LNAEWDDAVEVLERALGLVSANGNVEGWVRAALARALLGRGELDRAEREAQAGVDVAQASHSRCDELRAHLALAHTHLRRADPAALPRAEEAQGRAQELIDETSARAYLPELHECRAHLARRRGDERNARPEIDAARRLYTEMGATAQVERLAKETAP
jgi:hypothetical protein